MQPVISASILAADFICLGAQIQSALTAGADWVHIDVMDGHFVPNITMGPMVVETCRRLTAAPLDVHLMIEEPERHLEAFAKAGADILSIHVETCPHLYRSLQYIRQLGCKAGVVINPGTPAESLRPVLHLVDLVLIMTVNPGFGGQQFLPSTMTKVEQVRSWLDEARSTAWLEVDGGIDANTVPVTYAAGARAFVAGTAVFKHPAGIASGVQALRSAIPD
jgi:ribulose-phosphate 3-epimerase